MRHKTHLSSVLIIIVFLYMLKKKQYIIIRITLLETLGLSGRESKVD